MEETYRLIIEFKTIHPLRFWTAIFIVTTLMIYFGWRFLRKKPKLDNFVNQSTTSTVFTEKETVKPKLETKKENSTLEKPQNKAYTDTYVEGNSNVNEPNPIYVKPTEVKQEKVIPKVETFEVKPKVKLKSEEQLPKAKVETAKPKGEIDFVNYDISKVQPVKSYPVFRFPKKGTVVRSFRLGNTKRRGFKEESFQKSIEQYFGKDFLVL